MNIWELRLFELQPFPGSWNLYASHLFDRKPSSETVYAFLLDFIAETYAGLDFKLNVWGHSVKVSYWNNGSPHRCENQYILRLVENPIEFAEPLRLESFLTHSNPIIRDAAKSLRETSLDLGPTNISEGPWE